jgi:hypothetical protein
MLRRLRHLGLLVALAALAAAGEAGASLRTSTIRVERRCTEGGLVKGTISLDGREIGAVAENELLRVRAGSYRGAMRFTSGSGHAQGPFGGIAKKGDFLLEIAGARGLAGQRKTDVLLHGGTRPEHSEGCILLGPIARAKDGSRIIPDPDYHPLAKLREAFYGSGEGTETPAVELHFEIVEPASGLRACGAAACKKGVDTCKTSAECCSGCCNRYFEICGRGRYRCGEKWCCEL